MPEWVQRAVREFQCQVRVEVDSFLGRVSSLEIPTLVQERFMLSLHQGVTEWGLGIPPTLPCQPIFPAVLSALCCSHIPKHVYFSCVNERLQATCGGVWSGCGHGTFVLRPPTGTPAQCMH